ncbi:LacI family transcriptional regulator [Kineosporia rhizophila]|uniref:LacI family DNA-binding transcriptional regulator n=1 Tax=Kineosporia TaxID=49184 RepID=UPI001E4A7EDA|nr:MULTISPECIES: LacI family DNA-binding transcriptional regulator [Kineosporia]MCE0537001.1 LacI family transcriptional regulator [Kineosporia rhizophila]
MADVARLAGVSVSTVSYALSGTRPISVSTRERIEQAMLDLGYTPNAFARGLKSKRSRIIAFLLPAHTGNLRLSTLEYVLGASDHAQERGYHLMLWTTGIEAVDDLANFAGQGLVDGVLVMDVRAQDPRIPVLADAGVPFTTIGHHAGPDGSDGSDGPDRITTDFDSSAQLAVGHLAELGHHILGFVDHPPGDEVPELGRALAAAARRAGVELVSVRAGRSEAEGRAAFEELVGTEARVSAVIVSGEHAVPGLMRAAADFGRRIPDDLSMMCIDMAPPVAELTTPPMSTVGPFAAQIGQAAVDLLLRRLDGEKGPARQLLFRGELNLRGSCAPAPVADQLMGNSEARSGSRQRRYLR